MGIIGIDLGTTNTVATIDGSIVPIGSRDTPILPSVVAFPPTGDILVGDDARRRRVIDPKNTVFSSKRIIGRTWHCLAAVKFRRRYQFDLIEKDDTPYFFTRAGAFTAVDIAARILETARSHPRIAAVDSTSRLVIAVPNLFGEQERVATAEAGRQAGFPQVATIDESSATVAAYLAQQEKQVKYVAVYDLGGGTFDLALVDCSVMPYGIVGHAGDLYLGGDELDLGLARWVADEVLRNHGWDLRGEKATFARLVVECEEAKILVSQGQNAAIDLFRVDPAAPPAIGTVAVPKEVVEQLAGDLLQRSFLLCDQVLRQANLTVKQIDAVFVAGGATKMPLICRGVEKYFGKPVFYPFDPMQVVAIGAGIAPEVHQVT